jgi:O-antigen/teichoic acid export membrane protein
MSARSLQTPSRMLRRSSANNDEVSESSNRPTGAVTGAGALAVNAIAGWGRHLSYLVLLFLLTPFMLRTLGPETYGMWSLVLALTGILELADLGLTSAVVRLVADLKGRGDEKRLNVVLGTVWGVYLALSGLVALALVASVLLLPWAFDLPAHLVTDSRWALLLIGGRAVIGLPLNLFRSVLHGMGLARHGEATRAGTTLLYGLGVWIALSLGYGVIGLAGATVVSSLALWSLTYLQLRRLVPWIHISARRFSRAEARRVVRLAAAFMTGNVVSLVATRMDAFVLQWLIGLPAVAVYAIASRLSDNLLLLTKQFIHALSPAAAERAGASDLDGLRAIALRGTKFAFAITIPAVLFLLLLAEPLITHWIHKDFAPAAAPLQILAVSVLVSVGWMQASGVIAMTGHHRFDALASLSSAGMNLAVTVPLVLWLGVPGAAIGTLVAATVVGLVVVIPRMLKVVEISSMTYLRKGALPALLPGLVVGLFGYGMRWLAPPTGLLHVALQGMLIGVVYGLIFALFGTDAEERRVLARKLGRFGRFLPFKRRASVTPQPARSASEPGR